MTERKVSGVRAVSEPHLEAEIEDYGPSSAVRASIENADVLLFRGASLTSRIIEIGTHSCYTHAAVAFRSSNDEPFRTPYGAGRVCLVEAVGTGVRMHLLSEELATYEGAVELWRLKPPYAERLSASGVIAEARRYIGRPYAFGHLLNFVVDWATLGWLHLRSRSRDKAALFCSQLVSRAYFKGGVDLNVKHGDAATAPGDLVAGGRLAFVHAFTKGDKFGEPPSTVKAPGALASTG